MNKRLGILTTAVLLLLTAAITFISCDKDEDPIPEAEIDLSTLKTILEVVGGEDQSGFAGETLDKEIEILVKDVDGNIIEGEVLYFTLTEGSVSSTTATTNERGIASVKWTLGEREGVQYLAAVGTKTITVAPITVEATAEHKLEIGEYHEGGIIFYIDETKRHGLVCAYSDQSTSAEWGCESMTGADGTATGTGAQNTIDIVEECGGYDNAAAECADCEYFSYSDWFLPSKDELNLLYEKKAIINAAFEEVSGSPLSDDYYWSSSETESEAAWLQDFETGEQHNAYKYNTISVRAIRAF